MKVVSIHGIHDNGDDGVDRMGAALAHELGVPHWAPALPKRWAIEDWSFGPVMADAELVEKRLDASDIVITHSRGAYVLDVAMREFNASASDVFMFSPALPSNLVPGDHGFERLFIIHNQNDRALKWSRFLPFHPYATFFGGSLGRDGFQLPPDKHKRIRNIDASECGDGSFLEHSGYWQTPVVMQQWVSMMTHHIAASL